MKYNPDSVLLNNVYIPFYTEPVLGLYDCSKNFTNLELSLDGRRSVISLDEVYPYIDLSYYDYETQNWFWTDKNSLLYRQMYDGYYYVTPYWNIGVEYGQNFYFDPNNLYFESITSGVYTITDTSNITLYKNNPINVIIDNVILTDKTNYADTTIIPDLSKHNTIVNKEFYYNFTLNKIITNQDLSVYNPESIKILFKETVQNLSVKCVLNSNDSNNSYLTPAIDNYLLKLNGQSL